MLNRLSLLASLALFCLTTALSSAAQPAPVNEAQKTTAAVLAVEHDWTQAEMHGNVAYLEALLLPQYRSVNPDGVAHPKSAILANAVKNGKSGKMARLVAAYAKAHPYRTLVTIQGSTAVVTFYDLKKGPQKGITSCDIFTFVGGRWHALYSQHNPVN